MSQEGWGAKGRGRRGRGEGGRRRRASDYCGCRSCCLSQRVALAVSPCCGVTLCSGLCQPPLENVGFLFPGFVIAWRFSSARWRLHSRLFHALSPGSCSDSVGLGSVGVLVETSTSRPTSSDSDLRLCPQHWVVDVPLASCRVLQNFTRAQSSGLEGGLRACGFSFAPPALGSALQLPPQSRAASRLSAARPLASLWLRVVPVHFELLGPLPRAIEQV